MLTDQQIVEMRTKRAKGESVKALAEAFGCKPQTASNICTGYRRPDAGGPISDPASAYTGIKVTPAIATRIKRMAHLGQSHRHIGGKLRLSAGTVCKALHK